MKNKEVFHMAEPKLNPQAIELNETIQSIQPTVYNLLSKKGKAIYYPKKGILAQGAEAKGKNIDATIGIALEDDGTPMALSTVKEYLSNIDPADAFPYAPSIGVKALRLNWKEQLLLKNPALKGKSISTPVVTAAITHGLSMVGYLFCDDGDAIIHADLFWGNYRLVFINAYGARLQPFRFFENNGFDIESFKKEIAVGGIGKKIILLNFPNNPAGYTPTNQEVQQIIDTLKESAAAGNRLVVVLDDAYFGLVFKEGIYQYSLFSELADLHENLLAVKLDAVTKEDYAWGLRVGFMTFGIKNGNEKLYEALEQKAAGAIRGNISNACHLSQTLVLKSFISKKYEEEKKKKLKILERRFIKVNEILSTHPEYHEFFDPLPFNSGYFMCVKLKNIDAEKLRKHLLEKYSTGLISIENMIRIAFSATPTNKLETLFNNLYLGCQDLAK